MLETINKNIPHTGKLDTLLGFALALPGLATAAQASQTISTTPKVGAFYGSYSEDRYTIDKHEAFLSMPLSADKEISVMAVMDSMTGASVAGYLPRYLTNPVEGSKVIQNSSIDANHTLVEALTGQSIVDKRRQVSAKINYYIPDAVLSLDGGYSTENDFQSFFSNASAKWEFNKKNTVLETGFGYVHNISTPVKKNTEYLYVSAAPNYSDNKGQNDAYKMHLGLNQIINKNFYIQQTAELSISDGDLSDPYKIILYVGNDTLNWPNSTTLADVKVGSERRPNQKTTGAFVTSLVHYVPPFDGSLHFDYRFAMNSWQMRSHTFNLSYTQPISTGWEVTPKFRYYTQSAASFYALVFHTQPSALYPYSKELARNKASSDYRLSSFGTFGLDLTVSKRFDNSNLKISATAGYAKTSPTYGFTKYEGPRNATADYTRKFIAVQLSADLSEKTSFKKSNDLFSTRSGEMYKRGTFTLQPLSLTMTELTFGKGKEDTNFTWDGGFPTSSMEKSMYQNQRSYGLSDGHRNALSYHAQLGYFIKDRIELFTDLGISHEKELKDPTIIGPRAFKFDSRTTYHTGLGMRYYFETNSNLTPYVGFLAGVQWQPKTTTNAYLYDFADPTQFLVVGPRIGNFTIFKSQQLFKGGLVTGLSYLFKENIALNLDAGLHFHQQNKEKNINIGGFNYTIRDNKDKFTIPLKISVKFSF